MIPMPAVVVIVFCKAVFVPSEDDVTNSNSDYTKHYEFQWATEHSKMVCKREEISLIDPNETPEQQAQPYTQFICNMTGLQIGAKWDHDHPGNSYKFYRTACPVKIIDTQTGAIIGWKIPECSTKPNGMDGQYGTLVCEGDVAI
jgi:hypothetical protein